MKKKILKLLMEILLELKSINTSLLALQRQQNITWPYDYNQDIICQNMKKPGDACYCTGACTKNSTSIRINEYEGYETRLDLSKKLSFTELEDKLFPNSKLWWKHE